MARTKIDLPDHFSFTCHIPVRITDINYGGHVGNDTILTILHEARMQFFKNIDHTEMNFAGTGMLMADVAIEFRSELFYGDIVIAFVTTGEISKIGFELLYKLEKEINGRAILVAKAKTGMICYDYENKKIAALPEEGKQKLLR